MASTVLVSDARLQGPAWARIDRLVRLWKSHADRGWPPRFEALDLPFSIAEYLPGVLIVGRAPDGRFRFRLIGTEVVAWAGRDRTGQIVPPDAYGEGMESWQRIMNATIEGEGIPRWLAIGLWPGFSTPIRAVSLPLVRNGERQILSYLELEEWPPIPVKVAPTHRLVAESWERIDSAG